MIFQNEEVKVKYSKYQSNGRLAVVLVNAQGEMYDCLSVNLIDEPLTNDNCAYLDTNNIPEVEDFVINHNIANPTGLLAFSGYCIYPEYQFNPEVIE